MTVIRIGAVIIGALVGYFIGSWPIAATGDVLRNAVNVFAGADATLLGFLVSAGALLYAVANTRLARNLQRTGHFNKLLGDLFFDSTLFLWALIAALICLFVPVPAAGVAPELRIGVQWLVGLNVAALLCLIPLGSQFWLLLSSIEPDDSSTLE